MTHAVFICQSFFAVQTGCFVFHLWLITHGAISHHHSEKAQFHCDITVGRRDELQQCDQWFYARFLKINNELCPFMGSDVEEANKAVNHNKLGGFQGLEQTRTLDLIP